MKCCDYPQGNLTKLHTAHGPKIFCRACLDSRIDMPRIFRALSDVPDYTPTAETLHQEIKLS